MRALASTPILILIANGFDEQPVVQCLSQLRAAGVAVGLLASSVRLITSACGLAVRPDLSLDRLPSGARLNMVVVPGAPQCVALLLADPRLHQLLIGAENQPQYVAAFRAAEPLLAQAGLPRLVEPRRYLAQGQQDTGEFLNQLVTLAVGERL